MEDQVWLLAMLQYVGVDGGGPGLEGGLNSKADTHQAAAGGVADCGRGNRSSRRDQQQQARDNSIVAAAVLTFSTEGGGFSERMGDTQQ